jgi:hypothetical protein
MPSAALTVKRIEPPSTSPRRPRTTWPPGRLTRRRAPTAATSGTSRGGAPITSAIRFRPRRTPSSSTSRTSRITRRPRPSCAASRRSPKRPKPPDMTRPRNTSRKATMRGIRRTNGVAPSKKTAISLDDLRGMMAALPESISGIRDRSLLLIGFAGGSLRGEISSLDLGPGRDLAHPMRCRSQPFYRRPFALCGCPTGHVTNP